jgi:hypothetical protein
MGSREPKRYGCCSGIVLIGALGFFGVCLLGIVNRKPGEAPVADSPPGRVAPQPAGPALLPEVAAFLASHPEYGKPTGVQAVPNWAKGKRQRVRFDSGRDLLFYEKGGAVATVYEDDSSEGRRKIWGEYDR